MRAEAKQFYRAATMALEHAFQHSPVKNDMDAAQVILSLDFAAEMLLKAVLLNRGDSIMSGPKHSLTLRQALKQAGSYKQGSSIEVLNERRDGLQHFASYVDAATARELYESVLLFVQEVHDNDLKLPLPRGIRATPHRIPEISRLELVADSKQLQRDVDADDSGTVVWAEGSNVGGLAVYAKSDSADPVRLTPDGEFEYMPKTHGTEVVCYRQSGGIVLYELQSGKRTLISESGGPTAIAGDWIAAQGLTIEDGLGGGVWLYDRRSQTWSQVSESGDSARLVADQLIWQELEGQRLVIKARGLESGQPRTLVEGSHPSPWGTQVAWADWNPNPDVHVTRLDGHEVYRAENGITPNLHGSHLAYLRPQEDGYSLVVDDISSSKNVLEIPWVGFPVGSGPVLANDDVYFESRANRSVHAIWRMQVKSDH